MISYLTLIDDKHIGLIVIRIDQIIYEFFHFYCIFYV
jgi:hypothetical protein